MTLTTSPSLRVGTSLSEGMGEKWETTLLSEREVGKAIPLGTEVFLEVYTVEACCTIRASPL